MAFATIPPTLQLIRDGKVRAIAVTGPQRSPALAGCANRRGIRPARLRKRALAGDLCAGRHAGADRDAAQRRGECDPARQRRRRRAGEARRRGRSRARRSNSPTASQPISRSGTTSSSAPGFSRNSAFCTTLDAFSGGGRMLAANTSPNPAAIRQTGDSHGCTASSHRAVRSRSGQGRTILRGSLRHEARRQGRHRLLRVRRHRSTWRC